MCAGLLSWNQQITPLILLHSLNPHDTDPCAEFPELNTCKWLRQQVRQLLGRIGELNDDFSVLNALPNKMIACINVFAPIMIDGILAQRDGRFVVYFQFHGLWLTAGDVAEQARKPNSLACRGGCGNILGLARRKSHYSLFLRLPSDWARTKEEEYSCRALTIIDVASHVTVTVAMKLWLLLGPPHKLASKIECPGDITQ